MIRTIVCTLLLLLTVTSASAQTLTTDVIIRLERDAINAPLCTFAWDAVTQDTTNTPLTGNVQYHLYFRAIGTAVGLGRLLITTASTSVQTICAAGEYRVRAFVVSTTESADSTIVRVIHVTTPPNLP